jgi:hypothetical protein
MSTNLYFIISTIAYYVVDIIVAFAEGIGTTLLFFAAGYIYANMVIYKKQHDGDLDLVGVLRQMSPKSKKDDNEDDLEVEYILDTELGTALDIDAEDDMQSLGDVEEFV